MSAAAGGRLIVCPTPIGNLEDITLRAIEALRSADVIACEDTRTTKVLLDRYEITTPRVRYDEHAEKRATPGLIKRISGGETVALVSDAGTPLVSDPGFVLLQAALADVGADPCALNAQTYLIDMYARHGFVVDGDEFCEDGIPHVPMLRMQPS